MGGRIPGVFADGTKAGTSLGRLRPGRRKEGECVNITDIFPEQIERAHKDSEQNLK